MTPRTQIAVVQVAVFVGGGLLAPVVHLAGHRPDHTHGSGGQVVAFETPSPRGEGPLRDEQHHHGSARPEPTARHEQMAEPERPLEAGHGHGSIAHLGLALLSTAPPLALPAPEPAGVLRCAPLPRAATLFQPSFPLPRPPPGRRAVPVS